MRWCDHVHNLSHLYSTLLTFSCGDDWIYEISFNKQVEYLPESSAVICDGIETMLSNRNLELCKYLNRLLLILRFDSLAAYLIPPDEFIWHIHWYLVMCMREVLRTNRNISNWKVYDRSTNRNSVKVQFMCMNDLRDIVVSHTHGC